MTGIWHILTRRKVLDETSDVLRPSKLSRHLGTGDLIALGVGSTLGLGVYVLAGHVARDSAGPSVVLSFLIAAIASLFSGLCYSEFGARVPRAGSAYVYSYVCVGEFIAFIIGWNLILEYVIGSASVSRGISLYLDTLLNDTLKTTFREIAPVNISFLSEYFDILAFALAFIFGVFLAFGMKESAVVNNIFTIVNILIILFVILAGSIKAHSEYWSITPEPNSPYNMGAGGFFPFGFAGTLKGAATCFFGFVGFDCIATTGEEVHNPKRAIPIAIVSSLAIIFLAYFGISTVLTLMLPYYLQDADAPIPYAFSEVGWVWAKWIVAIGGMFGLLASLFGSLFPLPRILYAMASDGLVFRFFGEISPRFKTPIFGTLFATLLTGAMAGLFELSHLVNMMSIGTLMAYTIVAACVLLLRGKYEYDPTTIHYTDRACEDMLESYSLLDSAYYDDDNEEFDLLDGKEIDSTTSFQQQIFERPSHGEVVHHESSYLMSQNEKFSLGGVVKQLFNCTMASDPTRLSSIIVGSLITFYCVCCIAFGLCIMYLLDEIVSSSIWAVTITSVFGGLMVICVGLIALQPKSKEELSFQVPLVPLVPCISIFINIYLMMMLDSSTWIRFGIWMAVGLPVYLMSLCIYDRGSNYLMHVQKSSINNTHKGSLNYAFDDTTECQERAVSFTPDVKITVQSPTPSESKSSITPEDVDDSIPVDNNEKQPKDYNSIHDQNGHLSNTGNIVEIEEIKAVANENSFISDEENTPDSYEEIDLLDQIIKEEEEASALSAPQPFDNSEYPNYQDFVPLNPIDIPHIDNNSSVSPGDGSVSLDVPSEQNVVALVHRENSVQQGVERQTSLTPDNHNDDGNVSTANEDVQVGNDITIEEHSTEEQAIVISDNISRQSIVFIPQPPPMDESYFASSLPVIKWKVVKQKASQNERDTSKDGVDNSEHLKFGTQRQSSFMKKLDALFQTKSLRKTNVLGRRNSSENLENTDNVQNLFEKPISRQKSEPNLVTLNNNVHLTYLDDNLLNNSSDVRINKLGSTSPYSISSKNSSNDHNGGTREESLTHQIDLPIVGANSTLSKKDLKKKLEYMFAKRPTMIADSQHIRRVGSERLTAKPNVKTETAVDDQHEKDREVEKPKVQENYTNTMKLQRARFDNVLKSIQLSSKRDSQNSIQLDTEDDVNRSTENV